MSVTGKTTTIVEVDVPMQEIRNLLREAGYWIPTSASVMCMHGKSPLDWVAGDIGGLHFRWEKTETVALDASLPQPRPPAEATFPLPGEKP